MEEQVMKIRDLKQKINSTNNLVVALALFNLCMLTITAIILLWA